MEELKKRTWVYLCRPEKYGMAGCVCGNNDPDWSEFVGYLWCKECQIDFVPNHAGVFDGPILVETMRLLGLPVDVVFDLESCEVIPFPDFKKKEENI